MIKAKIKTFSYDATFHGSELKTIKFHDFDINSAPSSSLVEVSANNFIGVSKWVSPKRTRSEPFARIYDTYNASKRITVIPIIKDEGKDGDLDRINSLTLAWMNLTNVYVIIAWYSDAEIKNGSKNKITNQIFDKKWINEKINEISKYQFDAHHWNMEHFSRDFITVFDRAINSYNVIEKKLNIKLHDRKKDHAKKEFFIDSKGLFDINKFIDDGLKNAEAAANREQKTEHKLEIVSNDSVKSILKIQNNLGGEYYLTVDEMIVYGDEIVLRESKNSSNSFLPSQGEIKDALFKTMLLKNIDHLSLNGKLLKHRNEIVLYGKNDLNIDLPTKELFDMETLKSSYVNIIKMLNKEAERNKILIKIRSNKKV